MPRRVFLAVALLAVLAATAEAQIVSNPVVTAWPPYTTVTRYAEPVAVPVAAEVCTPPVVSFYTPSVSTVIVPAPVTSYYVPVTAYRLPWRRAYYAPATVVYPAPTTAYYNPVMSYRMPLPPATTVYAAPMAAPVTSYYAPAVSAAVMSSPVPVASGCGCGGR